MTATILRRRNDWWTTGKASVGAAYNLAREELRGVVDGLNVRRIQLVIGPRRVGKSTLMQQAIGHLLKSGIEPKRILFFSGDDPALFDGDTTIGDVIEDYLSDVLHESASGIRGRVYIFIDEIHVLDDWQLWLKSYYEPHYNIKFVVSGSSASHLFDGAKESLLGRTDTLRLMPLDFMQFCRFWAEYRSAEHVAEFLEAVPKCSLYSDPAAYYEALETDAWRWDSFKPYVNNALREFLLIGGYPEYFSDGNRTLWQKRLAEDIIGQGLYRDIVSIYKIKAPDKLEKLLFFIADNNGQDFNMKSIADTIGCDNETVSAYLTYLSQAYMAIVLSSYSPNAGKRIRKNKTLYVLDNGIANALLHLPELSDTRAGHIVESVCARDALAVCEDNIWSLHYWRNKTAEVDLVIDRNTGVLPIEVKYRANAKQTSLAAFRQAFPGLKIPVSVVITKDQLDRNQDTLYIPFWLAR
jgi:predicted AAA+ superfamily ATPase